MLYALLLGGAQGQVHFVDPDRLTTRNRMRYPLWIEDAAGPKANWVENVARTSGLRVTADQLTAAEYGRISDSPTELAIAAVDTVQGRRDVTDILARSTLNAGVDGLQMHVSRHGFSDGYACLYCPYLDTGEALDQAAVYTELSGLSRVRVAELLAGQSLTEVDLRLMRESGRLSIGRDDELLGGRLQDLARLRLYAQAALPVNNEVLAVSAPFVSALAGAILAAEVQKSTPILASYQMNRRVDIDCAGLPTGWQSAPEADATGRCLCQDDFRRRAYRTMWPEQSAASALRPAADSMD
jgi:hypothetical protein